MPQQQQHRQQEKEKEWTFEIMNIKKNEKDRERFFHECLIAKHVGECLFELVQVVLLMEDETSGSQSSWYELIYRWLWLFDLKRKKNQLKQLKKRTIHALEKSMNTHFSDEEIDRLVANILRVHNRDRHFFSRLMYLPQEAGTLSEYGRLNRCDDTYSLTVFRNHVRAMSVCVFLKPPLQENRFIFTYPQFWILSRIQRMPRVPHNLAVSLHSFSAYFFKQPIIVCNPLSSMMEAFARIQLVQDNIIRIDDFKLAQRYKRLRQIMQTYNVKGADRILKNDCISLDYNPHVIICTKEFQNFFRRVFRRFQILVE